jgi:hypothetical protein
VDTPPRTDPADAFPHDGHTAFRAVRSVPSLPVASTRRCRARMPAWAARARRRMNQDHHDPEPRPPAFQAHSGGHEGRTDRPGLPRTGRPSPLLTPRPEGRTLRSRRRTPLTPPWFERQRHPQAHVMRQALAALIGCKNCSGEGAGGMVRAPCHCSRRSGYFPWGCGRHRRNCGSASAPPHARPAKAATVPRSCATPLRQNSISSPGSTPAPIIERALIDLTPAR